MLRRTLIAAFRRLARLYFRDVERAGVAPGGDVRGRVIVSNHPNALIDPIVVMTDAAECAIAPVAKSTLWSIPVLRWLLDAVDAVPVVRRVDRPDKAAGANDDAFDAAARHLEGGGNLLIFPEGTSHSGPKLAPMRTGAARMLLHADPAAAAEPLTFQAAALEFEHPELFRSRCLILWGPVRRVDEVVAGVDGDEARVAAVTAQIHADLADLLVEGETHADKLLVARVARLVAHDLGDATLGAWSAIGRRVEVAHRILADVDRDRVARVRRAVDAYHAELARLGLRDRHVLGAAGLTDGDRVRLAALAPLALAGAVLYGLPYFLPRRIARRADQDAVSTYKLAAALVVYPVWMGGLVAASLALLPPGLKLAGAAVAITSPFAALVWLDALDDRAPSVDADELRRAADLRADAMAAIADARAATGL